jgi:hypothetical protein
MRLAVVAFVFIVYLIGLISHPVVGLPVSIPSSIAAQDSSRASDLVVRSAGYLNDVDKRHLNHFKKRQIGAFFSWLFRGISVCFEYPPAS